MGVAVQEGISKDPLKVGRVRKALQGSQRPGLGGGGSVLSFFSGC